MKPRIALMVLVLAGAGCKDTPQQGLPPLPPPGDGAAAATGPVVAPPVAPADPAVLDGRIAACVAADLVRDANKHGTVELVGPVVDAWLEAPAATAAVGLEALAAAAGDLAAPEARAALLAEVGRGSLRLGRRDQAAAVFRRALAEAVPARPVIDLARDRAIVAAAQGLAELGEHAAVEGAVKAQPRAAAAAAVGYARAGDRDRAGAMIDRAGNPERMGERITLATALVQVGRPAPARALWADGKPRDAAFAAVALAAAVTAQAAPDVAGFIDDAEVAVSRANDLSPGDRVLLGLRLAELRHQSGDVAGAAKRRLALGGQVGALGDLDQWSARSRFAEVALAAGDVAAAEAEVAWALGQRGSIAAIGMVVPRVRLALYRGDLAAATEPMWTTAAAPTALGYALVLAGYRATTADAGFDKLLLERACPKLRSPGPR